MSTVRIALANVPYPSSPAESVALAEDAIAAAARERADLVCFPECYVPGYRGLGRMPPPPDPEFLECAWRTIAAAAGRFKIGVILGTERFAEGELRITALVVNRDGSVAGFQDKVQLDPSEDSIFKPGSGRRVFEAGPLKFGISICHEGFRYPETVRSLVRNGAQVVFHPHFHAAEPGSYRPTAFADPANSFHEKAALCRAAENTCYYATVNYATEGSGTTSAFVGPDGKVISWQPYGKPGLLVADIDLKAATGLLASRLRNA
jgi:predicted amidohydrolase